MIARLALVVVVALSCAERASAAVHRHVVIVGVNGSVDEDVPPLVFADDDAARYAEVLGPSSSSLAVLAVLDPESQRLFPDVAARARPPSARELDAALSTAFARIADERARGDESDLVFVYVGHGAVDDDGEGYVSLLDAPLSRRALFERVIAPSPARFNHVIVDACAAYRLLHRGDKQTGAAAFRRLLSPATLDAHPNTGVLLATADDKETHEWSRVRGGVFSHEVLSALAGLADVDDDGAVSYPEVGAFVEAANAGIVDARARVDLFVRPPSLHLARPVVVRAPRARLVLAEKDTGHFSLTDSRGLVLAEVNKNGEQPLSVDLVGTAPYYVERSGKIFGVEKTAVDRFGLAKKEEPVTLASRGLVSDALARGLFQLPFGTSYVRGYASRLARDVDASAMVAPVDDGWSLTATAGYTLLGVGGAAALLALAPASVAALYGSQLLVGVDELTANEALAVWQPFQASAAAALVVLGFATVCGIAGGGAVVVDAFLE